MEDIIIILRLGKKMKIYKRISLSVVFVLLSSYWLFANKGMNIIPLSSPIYEYVDALYTLEGHAGAQGARPWTESDLKQQIDRITPSNEVSQNIYEEILSYLGDDSESIATTDWNLAIAPSMAAHSNTRFDTSDKWISKVLNDKLIRANLGLYVEDYFAGNFGLSLGLRDSANASGSTNKTYTFYASSNEDRFNSVFSTNVPFLSAGSFDLDITDNSFISLGTPYVSISLGRGQFS